MIAAHGHCYRRYRHESACGRGSEARSTRVGWGRLNSKGRAVRREPWHLRIHNTPRGSETAMNTTLVNTTRHHQYYFRNGENVTFLVSVSSEVGAASRFSAIHRSTVSFSVYTGISLRTIPLTSEGSWPIPHRLECHPEAPLT